MITMDRICRHWFISDSARCCELSRYTRTFHRAENGWGCSYYSCRPLCGKKWSIFGKCSESWRTRPIQTENQLLRQFAYCWGAGLWPLTLQQDGLFAMMYNNMYIRYEHLRYSLLLAGVYYCCRGTAVLVCTPFRFSQLFLLFTI